MSTAEIASESPGADHFDVIVVGGGSSGAVIAARLTQDPWMRVALAGWAAWSTPSCG